MRASDTRFDSRVGFWGVKLSDEDIAKIECQRVVAMATNFGTIIAINWLYVDDNDYAIGYEVGLSGRRQNADIADTLHLRDVATATPFCFSMAYNFVCMIASDTLYDSRGGFSGSSYPMKT